MATLLPIPAVVAAYVLIVVITLATEQPWAAQDPAIQRDYANVTIVNRLQSKAVQLQWASTVCTGCDLQTVRYDEDLSGGVKGLCPPSTSCSVQIPSERPVWLQARVEGEAWPARQRISLNEWAWYEWTWSNSSASPTWMQIKPGNALNGAVPLLVFILILAGLAFLGGFVAPYVVELLKHRTAAQTNTSMRDPLVPSEGGVAEVATIGQDEVPKPRASSSRLLSLDTFRGGCLIIMIFVNYGGGRYWFLSHFVWNGLTVADLVFPWFVWMMGASTALSQHGSWRRSAPAASVGKKAAVRVLKLLLLSYFLDNQNGTQLDRMRIPGVLQYSAIAGALLAASHLMLDWTCTTDTEGRNERRSVRALATAAARRDGTVQVSSLVRFGDRALLALPELVPFWREWLVFAGVLTTYLLIQQYLPVPGCPTGYLGPGGRADGGRFEGCTGGAHKRVDDILWGDSHYYHSPTCKHVFECGHYDPEGTLGALTASIMAFQGLLAGRVLIAHGSHRERCYRWLSYGVAFASIGCVLCGGPANNGPLPINKNLWSPSFVFTLGGLGFLILALLYVLIDHPSRLRIWGGMPFLPLGMNSILIYSGSELFGGAFPFSWHMNETHAQKLGCNLCGVLGWILVAWLLNRKGLYYNL